MADGIMLVFGTKTRITKILCFWFS